MFFKINASVKRSTGQTVALFSFSPGPPLRILNMDCRWTADVRRECGEVDSKI